MRKTVAKRIHKYIVDQGFTPGDKKQQATRAFKKVWNETPWNRRHQLAEAMV